MSLVITEDCINCHLCVPACPDSGIYFDEADHIYKVNQDMCTECIERGRNPSCAVMCPVDCMPVDATRPETEAELWAKAEKNKQRQVM